MTTQTLSPPTVAVGAKSAGAVVTGLPDILLALAHEMRGVLSPLKVATELLAEPNPLEPPDLARMTAAVYEGVRWLERLTDVLTTFALVRCQSLSLQVQEFGPYEWVQSVVQLISPLLGRRGQQVQVYCPDPAMRIRGDPRWLGHALLNLLSNAVRYGRTGDIIEVGITREAGRVRISVTNHGTGPDPDPPGAVGPSDRMGVGLQVVNLIAALHGGATGSASRPGHYTVFWVDLPEGVSPYEGADYRR